MSPTPKRRKSRPDDRVPLAGSERLAVPGAHTIGEPAPDETVTVSIRLRPREELDDRALEQEALRPAGERSVLSRADLADRYGADPADIERVTQFAAEHGLDVVDVS